MPSFLLGIVKLAPARIAGGLVYLDLEQAQARGNEKTRPRRPSTTRLALRDIDMAQQFPAMYEARVRVVRAQRQP